MLDVRDFDGARALGNRAKEEFGRLDILVNNAGITRDKSLMMMSREDWSAVIDTDLTGVFNTTQACIGTFLRQKSGAIVNIASVSGMKAMPGQVNYSAAKAGLIGITKTLSKELGKKGSRVNAVAPGFIKTPMTAGLPQKILDMMTEKTPLRMLGDPSDVAYANLYLASDEARYENGCVLLVDGGLVV